MTDYALDTNVISEVTKDAPDPRVVAFLHGGDIFWLPSVVVHELEYGIALLPQGRRRNRLRSLIDEILLEYRSHILPLDRAGAEWAAHYRAQILRSGREPDLIDTLIAGIVKAHNMPLATRNVRDFERLDIPLYNPWNNGMAMA